MLDFNHQQTRREQATAWGGAVLTSSVETVATTK